MDPIDECRRLEVIKDKLLRVEIETKDMENVSEKDKERVLNYVNFAIDNVVLAMDELKKMSSEVN
ncbi:MAG: hypothetical protein J6Y02_11715 [Pseudobutyrivibrio sp.]|nr:hypothetical protein [Pseudobutyrivibrio sp.]